MNTNIPYNPLTCSMSVKGHSLSKVWNADRATGLGDQKGSMSFSCPILGIYGCLAIDNEQSLQILPWTPRLRSLHLEQELYSPWYIPCTNLFIALNIGLDGSMTLKSVNDGTALFDVPLVGAWEVEVPLPGAGAGAGAGGLFDGLTRRRLRSRSWV